jgi:hypothetical protein
LNCSVCNVELDESEKESRLINTLLKNDDRFCGICFGFLGYDWHEYYHLKAIERDGA